MNQRKNIKLTPRQIKTIRAALEHWEDHLLNGENPLDPVDKEPYNHGRNPYLNISELNTLNETLAKEEPEENHAQN
jgi:hypothetical protein